MYRNCRTAGNTTTLSSYLRLQDESGLLTALPKYAKGTPRKRAAVPQFQVHDNALMTACREEPHEEARSQPELRARYIKSAVGAHIVREAERIGFEIFYWREGTHKVDFVLRRAGVTVAVAVVVADDGASGPGYEKVQRRGLDAFIKRFSPHRAYIVGSTENPLETFLCADLRNLF